MRTAGPSNCGAAREGSLGCWVFAGCGHACRVAGRTPTTWRSRVPAIHDRAQSQSVTVWDANALSECCEEFAIFLFARQNAASTVCVPCVCCITPLRAERLSQDDYDNFKKVVDTFGKRSAKAQVRGHSNGMAARIRGLLLRLIWSLASPTVPAGTGRARDGHLPPARH